MLINLFSNIIYRDIGVYIIRYLGNYDIVKILFLNESMNMFLIKYGFIEEVKNHFKRVMDGLFLFPYKYITVYLRTNEYPYRKNYNYGYCAVSHFNTLRYRLDSKEKSGPNIAYIVDDDEPKSKFLVNNVEYRFFNERIISFIDTHTVFEYNLSNRIHMTRKIIDCIFFMTDYVIKLESVYKIIRIPFNSNSIVVLRAIYGPNLSETRINKIYSDYFDIHTKLMDYFFLLFQDPKEYSCKNIHRALNFKIKDPELSKYITNLIKKLKLPKNSGDYKKYIIKDCW